MLAKQEVIEVFENILGRVKALDPVNTRKWFDELTVLSFGGGVLEIGCPDEASCGFLEDNCMADFMRAAQQVTGHLVSIKFGVNSHVSLRQSVEPSPSPVKLHPDYTFNSFVVGPGNRLAHASCIAVSNALGNTYNPLFIYGSVGLGN